MLRTKHPFQPFSNNKVHGTRTANIQFLFLIQSQRARTNQKSYIILFRNICFFFFFILFHLFFFLPFHSFADFWLRNLILRHSTPVANGRVNKRARKHLFFLDRLVQTRAEYKSNTIEIIYTSFMTLAIKLCAVVVFNMAVFVQNIICCLKQFVFRGTLSIVGIAIVMMSRIVLNV